MRLVANDGGVLELLPRPDQPAYKAMTLPLLESRLLVFRSDLFSFSYKPVGKDALALMTWILDTGSQAARQTAKGFFGSDDALQHSEALGIFVGPPMPTGYRMHIMAMHAHIPGGAYDLEGFECMLTSGVDGFIHIPASRFDTELYCCPEGEKIPGMSYVRHAAMMSEQAHAPSTLTKRCKSSNNYLPIEFSEATKLSIEFNAVRFLGCFSSGGLEKASWTTD